MMKKRNYNISTHHQPGFTILLAALISSLLLAVGLAIFSITYKQILFSIIVKDSDFAFYAADTGLECAKYWDSKYAAPSNCGTSAFATSTGQPGACHLATPGSSVLCSGTDITATPPGTADQANYTECTGSTSGQWCFAGSASSASTAFQINFPSPYTYCAIVEVTKQLNSGKPVTIITARGYNTCASGDPNRVERAIQTCSPTENCQ